MRYIGECSGPVKKDIPLCGLGYHPIFAGGALSNERGHVPSALHARLGRYLGSAHEDCPALP